MASRMHFASDAAAIQPLDPAIILSDMPRGNKKSCFEAKDEVIAEMESQIICVRTRASGKQMIFLPSTLR